jgi:CRP/FNR family transcriptional regulator, cyclic AMP receptor protein
MTVNAAQTAPLSSPAAPEPGPLAHLPLFSKLQRQEQCDLFALMRVEQFEAHQTIFWFGDLGNSLFLINKGSVGVTVPTEDGKEMPLSRLKVGGFFGELGLLDGGPRTATVRALEPTEVLVLSRDQLQVFLRNHPDAAMEILTVMGQRQRSNTLALRGVKNANVVFEQGRTTLWQRASDIIAMVAASQWFTLFHLAWFGAWLAWNLLATLELFPRRFAWDPFPFGLLTMIVSLEAIFLSIFVMVSQNRQSQKDRLRVELDYQVNVKAQAEIMGIARRLDRIEELIRPEPASGSGSPEA